MHDKYNIGLWNKTSKKGIQYCNGKTTINGVVYKVLLFKNNSKKNEKSPDYSIMLTKV